MRPQSVVEESPLVRRALELQREHPEHVEDGRENAGAGNTITGGILTSDFPHVPHWQIQQAVIEALMRLDADGADNGN